MNTTSERQFWYQYLGQSEQGEPTNSGTWFFHIAQLSGTTKVCRILPIFQEIGQYRLLTEQRLLILDYLM